MTSPRNRIRQAPGLTAAVLLALSTAATQAAAANRQCVAAVEQHLQSLGLDAGAIAQTKYVTDIANLEFGNVREYQAWTPLKACAGGLVTKLTTSCRVKETYARGDCNVPGAKRG